MAIFTRQSLRLGPKVVPTEPVGLDPDHWATGSALNYLLLSRGPNADLTGRGLATLQNVKIANSAIGPMGSFNGTNATAYISNAASPPSATQFCVFQSIYQGSSYLDIMRHDGHFTGCQIGANSYHTVTWVNGALQITVYGNSLVFNDGRPHTLISTYDEKTGGFVMVDGTVVATINRAGSLSTSTNPLYLGSAGSSEWFPGLIDGFGYLDKPVTQAEAFDFCTRPFAMLRPDVRRQYYVAASAVAPGTTRQPVIWFGM